MLQLKSRPYPQKLQFLNIKEERLIKDLMVKNNLKYIIIKKLEFFY